MGIHKPSWFSNDRVMVSTAPTCGLTKGGRPLPLVDPATGQRIKVVDPDTGELVDAVNDKLSEDMEALRAGRETDTLSFIPRKCISMRSAVPVYYDRRYDESFQTEMRKARFAAFQPATLAELVAKRVIEIKGGHGSPSSDQRVGDVPYIKVSDLRAGLVNINPTNRVPHQIAKRHWRGDDSKLQPFDILSPERTSKNIGDFCVLMPGQERVLLTKEIIVMRPGSAAKFDSFYLLWAMTLKIVRDQWKRVVFMQTNREDVGKRYLEISIPVPTSRRTGVEVSQAFRGYYQALAAARVGLSKYLEESNEHHFFVSGAEAPDPAELVASDVDDGADEGAIDEDEDE